MQTKSFDPYEFSKKTMDGVDVYYKNLPMAPCINVRVVFNTGAFNDPIGKEGLSHFLEHMIFDGSPKLKDKKAIKEWSKKNALDSWNAWTNFYNTIYWLKCLPEKFEDALDGMKDMIFRSYLRPEDVEHERKVITQEAWGRFQNEKFLAYIREFLKTSFPNHNLSRLYSALGWPETISGITNEDIRDWHKSNYGKGNFFIVLTGAIEESDLNKIELFLKDLPTVNASNTENQVVEKPKIQRIVKTADEIGEVKEQVEITLMSNMPKLPHEENDVAWTLVGLIYDLLYEKLRIDHSLCYNTQVSSVLNKTYSQFIISLKTEEKNIELVEREIESVVKDIQNDLLKDKFELVKRTRIERIKSEELLSSDIAGTTLHEISKYDGHVITKREQLAKSEAVSYEDVKNFCAKVFEPGRVVTEIILPSSK